MFYALSKHLPDPRDGFTGESYFILYFQGKKIEIVLNNVGADRDSDPVKMIWRVLRVREREIDKSELLEILKEALSGYGLSGRTDDRYERLGTKRPNVQAELIVEAM